MSTTYFYSIFGVGSRMGSSSEKLYRLPAFSAASKWCVTTFITQRIPQNVYDIWTNWKSVLAFFKSELSSISSH